MALQNVGIEILHFPAPDRLDKVLEVAGLGTEFLDHTARQICGSRTVVGGNAHRAVLAFHNDPDAGTFVDIHVFHSSHPCQTAHLKDQRSLGIIMNDELGVGRGPVIHIAHPPADTQYLGRKSGFL